MARSKKNEKVKVKGFKSLVSKVKLKGKAVIIVFAICFKSLVSKVKRLANNHKAVEQPISSTEFQISSK